MSADIDAVKRLLRQHLRHRHPQHNWWTAFLLRRMTFNTLCHMHQWEHDTWPYRIAHADDDFSDVTHD